MAREIVLPYAPRDVFRPYHNRTERWACIVAHRRCGKTVACINDKIKRAVTLALPHGRYAYVAPFLAQAKEVAWEYLKRYAQPIIADKNEGELWVELLNGARIRIHGADNPDRLRGPYLDGVVMDEYADMRPSVWGEVIRPMLADRRGWATFIGTPKGRNEFFQVSQRAETDPAWFFTMLRASETGVLLAEELREAESDMTPEQYAQEFECSFDAAILGAYFGKEIAQAEREGRVTVVEYDKHTPVHTAWDLGIGDSTAIWFFQVVGKEIHFIDHYEAHGQKLDHYLGVLASKPYAYEFDFVPHDARARELIYGRSRVEYLATNNRKVRVLPQTKVDDAINAGRLTLPRCWFDALKCSDGLEALRQYRTDYDEKTKAFRDRPRHDWTSHSADAFKYACIAWREMTADDKPQDPIKEMLRPKTFNELMAEYEQEMADD